MRTGALLATVALVGGCTCRDEPVVEGQVVDWWGHGVPDASLALHDTELPPVVTDAQGAFELPMQPHWTVTVTGPGILMRTVDIDPPDPSQDHHETIEVVPVPPGPGFHLVGPEGYLPLRAEPVVRVGDGLSTRVGIRGAGDVVVEADPLRVVFHTPLKMDEVDRLDLALHRLEWVEDLPAATVEGRERVDADLWVSAGKLAYEKIKLGGESTWAYRATGLHPGTYAFVSNDLLDPRSDDAFEKIAPSLRVIYPFRVE